MTLPEAPQSKSERSESALARQVRAVTGLGLGLVILSLIAGLVTLGLALGEPRSGIPAFASGWTGPRLASSRAAYPLLGNIPPHSRIIAVDRVPVADAKEVRERIQRRLPRAPIEYTLAKPDGTTTRITIPLEIFSMDHALRTFLPAMLIGILFLLAGIGPVLAQPKMPQARALAVMSIGIVGNYLVLLPDYLLGYRIAPWGFILGYLGMAGLWHFGMTFPSPLAPLRRAPLATLATIYGTSAIFWLAFALIPDSNIRTLQVVEHVQSITLALGLGLLILNIGLSWGKSNPPHIQRQARVSLPGALSFVLGVALLFATTWGFTNLYVPPIFYLVPFASTTLIFAWGMLSSELFELDSFARTILGRSALLLCAAALFGVLLGVLEIFISPRDAWTAGAFITLILASALPLAPPLYNRVENFMEQALFPRQRQLREALVGISREIGRLRDTNSLANYSRRAVAEALPETQLRLVIGKSDEPLMEVAPPPGAVRIDLPLGDPIREALARGHRILPHLKGDNRADKSAYHRAAAAGIDILIPLATSKTRVGGLLATGPKGGRRLTTEDGTLLESLAAPIGVALENAERLDEIKALQERLERENLYLREQTAEENAGSEIIGKSQSLLEAMNQLRRAARSSSSVLIIGETGTGKELAVRLLHTESDRADRVLVKLPCAALPEQLLESELFGHEKGAFTGADKTREGRLEVADGGTIFFDDVDTLSLAVQAKILRAIQEGEIQRLGSNETRKVDVRVVAATNRNLLAEVQAGRFREDLYYRLAVVPVRLPPLRERLEDLPLLIEHIAAEEGTRLGREIREVHADSLARMKEYDWPGNIRELRNTVERAIVLEDGPVLRVQENLGADQAGAIPSETRPGSASPGAALGTASLQDLLRDYKKALIESALQQSDGNQRRAAELLGLHRPSLTRMIKDLGLREDS
ncbi:MAG TPA: hypothetical protein DCG06_10390 [Deltaproteobacteria bacterium]|nr:hypothetical protein [Deltaproteobacteria bacterium]